MRLAPTRPEAAGPPMPTGLTLPQLSFPTHDDAGWTSSELPAPPARGSAAEQVDLAVLHQLQGERTVRGNVWARAMDLEGHVAVFTQLAAQTTGNAAELQALVGAAMLEARTRSHLNKTAWNRPRPFTIDPTIDVVGRRPTDFSYPSGHTNRAWAAARVIAAVDPALRDAAYALAREVAISRMYAGAHFPSDVLAGARTGVNAGDAVLAQWRAGSLAAAA
ncbi:MAG: Acid phosphatase [Thermoleophilia bacterium]|nr:Acid phosphatase [Thermoleophilia bacterium]